MTCGQNGTNRFTVVCHYGTVFVYFIDIKNTGGQLCKKKLNNDIEIPILGFGVFQITDFSTHKMIYSNILILTFLDIIFVIETSSDNQISFIIK